MRLPLWALMPLLIGSNHSADTLRLRGFLARNGHPHTYVDVEIRTGFDVNVRHGLLSPDTLVST